MERAAGILLSLSSLPSPHGIGTMGEEARQFVDFLADAGQKYWQLLPVGPISYGDSPYQSFSAFAGNPYYIDLDALVSDGLLTAEEVAAPFWGDDPEQVDYGAVYAARFELLEKAFDRGWKADRIAVASFAAKNRSWLPDYALFMALKRHFGMAAWTAWPLADIRLRKPAAVERWTQELDRDVRFFTYLQYLFRKQWDALKEYAGKKGIQLIGDLPIYVALDSADVWANPGMFQLDEENLPTAVAGVPPDAFTADGQLWGNPLYDWKRMAQDGFSWWEERMRATLDRFDVARLDHFRGLESYWAVPSDAPTAATGRWEPGPGSAFVNMLREKFPQSLIIAEDLGYVTKEVQALLDLSGFPGMKVLQFAFDHREDSDYLPHHYPVNSICYTGAHDNTTILGWLNEADSLDVAKAKAYLGLNQEEGYDWGMLRGGMGSVSRIFIAQMQDYLGLGDQARMNRPGIPDGNWRWRMAPGAASPALAEKIKKLTVLFGR